ncbi:hypothetical protein WJX81_006094 [Elliptochloris bilobata]|uniref:m7GpppX diphosphatase n=1 Tax=Elliptochloris bilobata TaxID=381761 RepID=A0AAW1RVA6_9CHLO
MQGDSESAGIYGSQSREDYSEDDVEHYFNYMGMLATEGTYDRLNSMLSQGLAPVDLLLMMAASENDAPKVAELLRAGADASTRNLDGKCARELATSDLIFELLDEPKTASIAVLGRFGDDAEQAVVLLSRTAFAPDHAQDILRSLLGVKRLFQNDVYTKGCGSPAPPVFNVVNFDIIYPATEKHISKHTAQTYKMAQEDPELYAAATLPFINAIPAQRLAWVYNILEKRAEVDRLIFEDPDEETGFMLHPDLKWDQSQAQSLYCIALCVRRDLRCLRDLNASHLPLLHNIRSKCHQAVLDRYGVGSHHLRLFIHYPPSYYHLHVHVAHVQLDGGAGMAAGKAHLLDDVIDSITLLPDYYARRTLSFTIGSRDPLLVALADAQQGRKRKAPEAPEA